MAMADPPTIATVDSFTDARLQWSNGEPGANGNGGRWAVEPGPSSSSCDQLVVVPAPGLDYWCRTFYDPPLVKHDAQTLLCDVAAHAEATLTTAFTLAPREQFDQAGIMVLVHDGCWVKAGLEFTDGTPRLSCVVTNDGFSDWSTTAWPQWDAGARATSIRVRLTKLRPGPAQGPAVVVEAAPVEGDPSQPGGAACAWSQVRIAPLRSGEAPWRMGLFAISPIAQSGGTATFHHLHLGPKVKPVHNTDPKHAAP